MIKRWNKFNEDLLDKISKENDEKMDRNLINKMSRLLSDTFYPNGSKQKYPIKCNGYIKEGFDYEVYFSIYDEEKGDYTEHTGINTIYLGSFLFDENKHTRTEDDDETDFHDFYQLNGETIESTKEENGTIFLNTSKGKFEIACGGGADANFELDAQLPAKIVSIDYDGYEVTFTLQNGDEIYIADETGGEGLEIWKSKE